MLFIFIFYLNFWEYKCEEADLPYENAENGESSLKGRFDEDLKLVLLMADATTKEGEGRIGLELVKSVSDKHLDLLRPSSRYYSIFKGQAVGVSDREKGKYSLIRDPEDHPPGLYDRPLPCFGCGVGWFSFLVGFICPLLWYYATILYFGNYYRKDPRERAGLAASAIAALACSVILLIVLVILLI